MLAILIVRKEKGGGNRVECVLIVRGRSGRIPELKLINYTNICEYIFLHLQICQIKLIIKLERGKENTNVWVSISD